MSQASGKLAIILFRRPQGLPPRRQNRTSPDSASKVDFVPLPSPEPTFDFIDLFAGVGGFHLALEGLGGRCVFASEIDDNARKVYEQNFDMDVAGDIRPLTEDGAATEAIPRHDVLCAGFPCQPFSKSGHQRGINETRGTLFFNILQILEARRPRFVILENVRNLAGPRQRDTWDTIIRHLRRLGYRVAGEPTVFSPHLLPLQAGGRPQVRERVFILAEHVGTPDGRFTHGDVLVSNRPPTGWSPDDWRIEDLLLPDDQIPDLERYRLRDDEVRWIDAWNDFSQIIDDDDLPGFPIWADAFVERPRIPSATPEWKRTFLLKNSELYCKHRPAIDSWLAKWRVADFPPSRRRFEWQARKWQPAHADRDLWQLVMHMRPSGLRVKPPTYLPALVAITQTSIIGPRRRRITPREAARLQGFPDEFEVHSDDAAAYKQFGNAVNVGAVQHVAKALFDSSPVGWPGAEGGSIVLGHAVWTRRGDQVRLLERRAQYAATDRGTHR
jgi:DNA (cytosine-5)-methyltransferase 1